MSQEPRLVTRYVSFLLRRRVPILIVISLITAFFVYRLTHLKIHTEFFDLYPPSHPYIQLYNEYRQMFGGANVLVGAVEVKEGDIYTIETIRKIDQVTKALLETPGVNALQVISLTHPKLKNIQVSSWGIQIRPVIWPEFPRNQKDLDNIRRAVYTNEGIRGFYVSPDDKAASIHAGFWEEGGDPLLLYERLQEIKAAYEDENTEIYFTGYPALYAHIYHLAPQVFWVFGATGLVMMLLLFGYFRTWQGIVVPLLSVLISAIWGLGFAGLFGYNLDPLVMVVPILLTATALSHSVQSMNRYYQEYGRLSDKQGAIVTAYSELFAPATLSIITDGLGILTIAVATIPLMQKLAFFCSFWIITILVSVVTLNPLIVSFMKPPKLKASADGSESWSLYSAMARALSWPSRGRSRVLVVVLILAIFIVGFPYARQLKVGDTEAGAALLFPDHPYNVAYQRYNDKFVGVNQLVIIVEGTEPDAIKRADTLAAMEEFQRYMEVETPSGGSLTITDMVKTIYRMYHEGHPKWSIIPEDPRHLGQIFFLLAGGTAPGEMDRWVSPDYTNATITVFFKSISNELIKEGIAKAKAFIDQAETESVRFRLAGGLVGVLAAVNEEVEWSFWVSLAVIFTVVFFLCTLTYRSFVAGVILIIPLAASQVLAEVFMLFKGIDLNINSLPVAAVAVGIGVDYGIYLMSRIVEEYKTTGDLEAANRSAVATTGKAIVFTATTLIAGVIFWFFVDLKFQAEMGLLLALLMFLNMVSALVFIPTLVSIIKPRFVCCECDVCGAGAGSAGAVDA